MSSASLTKTPPLTSSHPEDSDDLLSGTLESKLANPETSADFDLHQAVNQVLGEVGMTAADSGGKLSFYGSDPIIASSFRFGTMAAVCLAAKSIGAAAIWRARTGEGQDISVDVRKALQRFACFFERKYELINGRPTGPARNGVQPVPGYSALSSNTGRPPHGGSELLPRDLSARPQFPQVQPELRVGPKCDPAVGFGRTGIGRG